MRLAALRFLAQDQHILLLGPPDVGQSHLATEPGMEAIAQGMSVHRIFMVDLLEVVHRDAK